MRALWLLPLALAIPLSAAPAQTRIVPVQLTNFAFIPRTIHLRAGEPVVLHLVSRRGHHNFVAPRFFAAARGVAGPVRNGGVEVHGRHAVDVLLIPARGTYRLRCTHTFHSFFGMRGRIIVQ